MVCKKSIICLILGWCLTFSALGCASAPPLTEKEARKLPTTTTAWVAYWDIEEGIKAVKKRQKELKGLVYFAANFTPRGSLVEPLELKKAQQELGKGKYTQYLSVVNDVTKDKEVVALKDATIVEKVLATSETRKKHIEELLALAKELKVEGIEIDYENIWKNDLAKKVFPVFVEDLFTRATAAKLKLRIVLEPSTPFRDIKFISGPEYVVMFYNLYGLHSGPGPKANKQFIYNTLSKMASLPQPKGGALATGGCQWSNKGKPQFITEKEALTLQKKYMATVRRDEDSQCQVFKYRDGTTVYEVWYADKKTLEQWATWVKQGNITNISFWRL